jgi:hypothetical protein
MALSSVWFIARPRSAASRAERGEVAVRAAERSANDRPLAAVAALMSWLGA